MAKIPKIKNGKYDLDLSTGYNITISILEQMNNIIEILKWSLGLTLGPKYLRHRMGNENGSIN